jgi:crossover junction endodeoxyribonuclease RusA
VPEPRTFTIELPPGLKLLSLNDREHWAERARRTEALKKAAWAMALQAKIPRLERVAVTVEYQPRDLRHYDAENTCAPSGKACLDGIVAAGVLEDDECPRYVTGIWCTIGSLYPKGRLVLHLTEVAATGGTDGAA